MTQYQRQFPDFDDCETFDKIFAAVSEHGFKDQSWHNDVMPCMIKDCGNDFHLIIWVDFKDPDKAEFVEHRKDGSIKQFMFGEQDDQDEYTEEWQYDDVDALIAHVERVVTA